MLTKALLCTALLAGTTLSGLDYEELLRSPKTTPKTVFLTAATGMATGMASIAGLEWLCNYLKITNIPLFFGIGGSTNVGPISVNAAVGAHVTTPAEYIITGFGLAIGGLAAWLTYRYSPEGTFNRAHGKFKQAALDEALNNILAQEQNLLNNIAEAYIHSHYPRVAAYNDFLGYLNSLQEAEQLFKQAMNATDENDKQFELRSLAGEYRFYIECYITGIKRCIQIIRTSPDWQKELKGYNAMLARQAQERAALATQQLAANSFQNHYICIR